MSRYIDADALLERSQAHLFCVGIRNGKSLLTACKNYLLLHVNDAPTADVAPVVHGHWEHVAYDKYRCSVCGTETTVDTFFDYPLYKGCPYCLAIMDGKDGKADGTI